jgi:hypothetical protein
MVRLQPASQEMKAPGHACLPGAYRVASASLVLFPVTADLVVVRGLDRAPKIFPGGQSGLGFSDKLGSHAGIRLRASAVARTALGIRSPRCRASGAEDQRASDRSDSPMRFIQSSLAFMLVRIYPSRAGFDTRLDKHSSVDALPHLTLPMHT